MLRQWMVGLAAMVVALMAADAALARGGGMGNGQGCCARFRRGGGNGAGYGGGACLRDQARLQLRLRDGTGPACPRDPAQPQLRRGDGTAPAADPDSQEQQRLRRRDGTGLCPLPDCPRPDCPRLTPPDGAPEPGSDAQGARPGRGAGAGKVSQ